RQADRLAGPGLALDDRMAARVPEGIDAELRKSRSPAEIRVVGRLETALPDLVASLVPLLAELFELAGRDLGDVPEQLRGEHPLRIAAQVGRDDLDARELFGVLHQVEDRRGARD